MIEIVPATIEHAHAIELREGDAREIAAMGLDKIAAVEQGLARALWAETYLVDGDVAAIVGVSCETLLGGTRSIWMLTGKPVDRCRKAFLRATRANVLNILSVYGTVTCNVHAEYAGAIRWLRWLGFSLGPARPMGSLGAPFHAAALHKGLRIGPATVAEIENAPNLRVISREFTEESLAPGLPRSAPNWPAYRALEAAGLLHPITARLDGLLIGFVGVLLAPPIATTERIFVLKAHRKSGAGLKLLHVAEEAARRLGSPVLQVVAPIDGGLSKVLPRVGYRESNRVFFKILPVAT